MESGLPTTPDAARAALQDTTSARERIADRATAPWWYHLGAALSTASLFIGAGLVVGRSDPSDAVETSSTLLVAVGACLAPLALLGALKRSTGVSIDRYSHGLAAWYVVVFTLFAGAFVLQQFWDVPHALAVAGVVALLATLVNERHLDASLRERVRAGR